MPAEELEAKSFAFRVTLEHLIVSELALCWHPGLLPRHPLLPEMKDRSSFCFELEIESSPPPKKKRRAALATKSGALSPALPAGPRCAPPCPNPTPPGLETNPP